MSGDSKTTAYNTFLRAGDHVLHRPSGETWMVSRVKPHTGKLAAFGWPPSEALIDDCTRVYACTDAEHERAVSDSEGIGR